VNITPELISIYLDGGLSPDEAAAVEQAIRADASLAAVADEFRELGEFLGDVEPVEISEGLRDRLYELDASAEAPAFEIVRVEPVRRPAWRAWAAAAAAVVLVAVGLRTLAFRPEIALRDFSRQALDAKGGVTETQRSEGVLTLRAGETVRAGEGERVSFRMPDGSKAVLFPGTTVRLGDPREQTLLEVEDGTLLCSVIQGRMARSVRAGGFHLRSGQADFGVRVEGEPIRAAGAVGSRRVRVTVSVSRGEIEVGENGGRERIGAYEEVVLEPGSPPRRVDARGRPLYDALVNAFAIYAFELLPGYFSNEHGVTPIARNAWMPLDDGGFELVVSDEGVGASAGHLVVRARAECATRLDLTLVRPTGDDEVGGVEISVPLGEVGPEWRLLSAPMEAFAGPTAVRKNRKIPVDRRLFVRLELRSADAEIPFELNGSLWAARPPADRSEVER
jgi:hypothetical protein